MGGATVPRANRLDYWKQKALEAESEFYQYVHDANQQDQAVENLARMILANRELERLQTPDFPSWL
jgi:hypothetical protein